MPETALLRRTPVFEWHRASGARLVDFAGWELPVQYRGVLEEHRAVRERAGLFDVSHMGEIWIRGGGAERFLEWLTPNHVSRLAPGRAHYTGLLTEVGTFVDDLLVYRFARDVFLLVVNAGNLDDDLSWIEERLPADVEMENASERLALLALQGPLAESFLEPLVDHDLAELRSFSFFEGAVAGVDAVISRTGYTGEDGFEIYVPAETALQVWEALLEGTESPVPVGLAARDTLRLEAGLLLHGHDIDRTVTALEAGLGWVVKLDKDDFIGRQALVEQRARGLSRRLVGVQLGGRRIGREGAQVARAGEPVGVLTSGTYSPTLEKAIALAIVDSSAAAPGTELEVDVRGRAEAAVVVELPFYRRTGRVRS